MDEPDEVIGDSIDSLLEQSAGDFDEVYEVLRSIEVVKEGRHYRLEIVRGFTNPAIPYTVHTWVQELVCVQPAGPSTGGKYDDPPEEMVTWRAFRSPWISQDSPIAALRQALGFLLAGQDDER